MANHSGIHSICIIGRPNVGKSSLFNWLIGHRKAVVVEESGTTRDRVEAVVNIKNYRFKIVDTGGYLEEDTDKLSSMVKEQIHLAIEEASIVVMVTSAASGLVPADEQVAAILRKTGKESILTVNKSDNQKLENGSVEFYSLGFGDPVSVSCLHRRGMKVLKERVLSLAKNLDAYTESEEKRSLKVSVVGRPNVGKSSFINFLLEKERVIVSDIPGTTRDSIDTLFSYEGADYVLIDTAGIRHKRKIKSVVDTFSMMRSRESIRRSDVVILLLDALSGITRDDTDILDFIEENGKACLVLVNKWDFAENIEGVSADEYERHLLYGAPRLRMFPISFVSALTGKNVLSSLSMISVLDTNLDIKVPTPMLNRLFEKRSPSNISIPRRKKRPNFLYITQTRHRPVEFSFFVNDPSAVLPVHLSFIENILRDNLPLKGIPIKVKIKGTRSEK